MPGTAVMTIYGVPSLSPVSTAIIPDRIEAGTLMTAAALTRGVVKISGCEPNHLQAVIHKLRLAGVVIDIDGSTIRVSGPEEISERRSQNTGLSGISYGHAGSVHGSDVCGRGLEYYFRNHI